MSLFPWLVDSMHNSVRVLYRIFIGVGNKGLHLSSAAIVATFVYAIVSMCNKINAY